VQWEGVVAPIRTTKPTFGGIVMNNNFIQLLGVIVSVISLIVNILRYVNS